MWHHHLLQDFVYKFWQYGFFYIKIFFDSDSEDVLGDLKLWNGNKDISTYICAWKQKHTVMHCYYWVHNQYHDFKHTYWREVKPRQSHLAKQKIALKDEKAMNFYKWKFNYINSADHVNEAPMY